MKQEENLGAQIRDVLGRDGLRGEAALAVMRRTAGTNGSVRWVDPTDPTATLLRVSGWMWDARGRCACCPPDAGLRAKVQLDPLAGPTAARVWPPLCVRASAVMLGTRDARALVAADAEELGRWRRRRRDDIKQRLLADADMGVSTGPPARRESRRIAAIADILGGPGRVGLAFPAAARLAERLVGPNVAFEHVKAGRRTGGRGSATVCAGGAELYADWAEGSGGKLARPLVELIARLAGAGPRLREATVVIHLSRRRWVCVIEDGAVDLIREATARLSSHD